MDAKRLEVQRAFHGRKIHQGLWNQSGRRWLRKLQAADTWRARASGRGGALGLCPAPLPPARRQDFWPAQWGACALYVNDRGISRRAFSRFTNCQVRNCDVPCAPKTHVAVEGAASPCSEGARQGVWDQMSHVAEEKTVAFFDLSNDTAKETRKTSRVVQDLPQNTITPNQPHAEADLLPLSSHHTQRCLQLVAK